LGDFVLMRLLYLIFVVLFCVFPSLETAADTGGSMGGGDWSSSSSGGSYSYSSSSSSSSSGGDWSSSSSSSGWSSSDSSGGGCSSNTNTSGGSNAVSTGIAILVLVLVTGLLVVVVVMLSASIPRDGNDPPDGVDISELRIAIDGRARKFVQTELARIATKADTKSAEGRTTMLREVSLLLRRVRDAWAYGGAVNYSMQPLMDARADFDKAVDNARVRFRDETIRNHQGTITHHYAPDIRRRVDEGAGLILVTIVIAARRELFTVGTIGNGEDLRAALEAASALMTPSLVAIEVVWQPSEDGDRLSSIELEAKYPPPSLYRLTGALAGKTFCAYCAGPYPAELVSCPHCGAPARERAA
jgi:uncharacterized membrane protein